ncbi:unnamed protein product, partial [Meganyctiphanes norvegica]
VSKSQPKLQENSSIPYMQLVGVSDSIMMLQSIGGRLNELTILYIAIKKVNKLLRVTDTDATYVNQPFVTVTKDEPHTSDNSPPLFHDAFMVTKYLKTKRIPVS